jgi:hypothetical protein
VPLEKGGHVDRRGLAAFLGNGTMISTADLRAIARARLRDSMVLLQGKRLDGAVYLCGYAVELALQARMCRTLKWSEFPGTAAEFKGLQSIKTQDLEILLRLLGVERRIKTKHLAEWSVVLDWDPEKRYQRTGFTEEQAGDIVKAATKLLSVL